MPNCDRIHETVIRDIVDIITTIKDTDEVDFEKNKKLNYSSIAKASNNLTLTFPVIVSNSMSVENAGMISKAIERKCVTMLQMLFSAISISDKDNIVDYLKQFHTNIRVKNGINMDDLIDTLDNLVGESAITITDKDLYERARADLKNINNVLPDNINETALNEFKILNSGVLGERTVIQEKKYDVQGDLYDVKGDYHTHKDINNYTTKISNPSRAADMKNIFDAENKRILPTDIKKANELVPTMMIVNFVYKKDGEDAVVVDNAIVGVKAKMYAVDSSDICTRIKLKNNDNNGLLHFIRATTREISFFKDFLFAIDKAKLDAVSTSDRGTSSKLWKVLERRSVKSKLRRTIGRSANDAAAISTLVVTMNEVEYLKKYESIDLTKPYVVRGIMESYNLMAFVIVDEASEQADFIFDTGDDIYETLSFNHLEREASDNSSKKVINLMTKLAR